MGSLRSMYEKVILDHNKAPHNFGPMEAPDAHAEGYNPLCGDQFTVYLKMDGDRITEARFEGAGCAISKSSASIMTTMLKDKTRAEVESLFGEFKNMVMSAPDEAFDEKALGKLKVFSGVRQFPIRVKCATLPWHTVLSALDGKEDPASTE